MPPRLTDEKSEALHAWIAYYRDMGVYDLYRRGDGAAAEAAGNAENPVIPQPEPEPVQDGAEQLLSEAMSPRKTAISPALFEEPVAAPGAAVAAKDRPAALQAIREEIGDCKRCPLCEQRNKIVFGDGDPNAQLMFVGEGPGADEDAQGLPFVGRGGQLLNNMINAMGLKREQVYIANIVKCRPPQNRTPEPLEANTCVPFLMQQIDVVRPRMIVALGSTAATYLLGVKASLTSLRGRVHDCRSSQLIVTYHPAYLLRDPRQKAEAWKDLQLVMKFLGMTPPKRSS